MRFEVVGSMPHLGRGDNMWLNMRGYIPFQVMATNFPHQGREPSELHFVCRISAGMTAEHLSGARGCSQDRRRAITDSMPAIENAFDEWDSIQESKMVNTIFDVMNMFLGAVGMVTLALGAIGVINIMLVAVSERTQEIGLRKALGRHQPQYPVSFLSRRTAAHAWAAGCSVWLFAGGFMALMGGVQGPQGFDPPKLVPMSAMLAIGSLTLAGVVAGLYPARKAALLQPVEALRQE